MPIARILSQSVLWRGLFYASSFLLNILIARHFEAALSGSIYYLINFFTLLHLVASLSMDSGIIYFVSKKEIAPGKILNFAVLWTFIVGIILWLTMNKMIDRPFKGLEKSAIISYTILFVCGSLLYNFIASLFYARNNFTIPSVIGLIHNLLLALVIPFSGYALIPWVTDVNYFFIYFAAFLSQAIIIVLAYQFIFLKHVNLQQPSGYDFKKLLKYSLLALVGNIAFFFLYRVDYWFVEKYCSTAELGNYIQVSKLGQLFFLLPSILATAIFPLTASDDENAMPVWLALISRTFLFLYTIICLMLIIVGQWLFPLIFGESFGSMYMAFIYLVPGILSLSTLFTLTAYNGGKNKLSVNLIGCIIAFVFVITGNLIFVPTFGINAAACISSIGYIIYEVYLLYEFKKENKVKLRSFFIFSTGDIKVLKGLFTSPKPVKNGI